MLDLGEAIRLIQSNPASYSDSIDNYELLNWLRELQYFRDKYPGEGGNPYLFGNPYLRENYFVKNTLSSDTYGSQDLKW